MKDYKVNGKVVEMTLENGKVVKCATEWVQKTMKTLDTDMEDVLLMWLEDNDYLKNEEQEELNNKAKANKVKLTATSEKVVKKTPKERTQKPQPEKEYIIGCIAEYLEELEATNIEVVNKTKMITFVYKNLTFSLDLVQKRPPKAKNE